MVALFHQPARAKRRILATWIGAKAGASSMITRPPFPLAPSARSMTSRFSGAIGRQSDAALCAITSAGSVAPAIGIGRHAPGCAVDAGWLRGALRWPGAAGAAIAAVARKAAAKAAWRIKS